MTCLTEIVLEMEEMDILGMRSDQRFTDLSWKNKQKGKAI